jgi:uncharacterized protein DUF4412
MSKFILRVCVYLFVSVFIVGGLARELFAGIIMEQVRYEKGSSQKDKGKIYISNNKVKFAQDGTDEVTILDLNTGEMTQIDTKTKRYFVAKPEEIFKTTQDAMAKAKAQMEEQLSKLPPEQRAKVEEMMKSHGISQPEASEAENLTLKATGTIEDIAGYNSRKFEVYKNGKLSEEIWTSKDVVPDNEFDSKKMANYMKEMEQMVSKANPAREGAGSGLDGHTKVYNQVYETGFPMRSVDYSSNGGASIEEVVSVTKADLPDNEFQPPVGFKKVTLQQMISSE